MILPATSNGETSESREPLRYGAPRKHSPYIKIRLAFSFPRASHFIDFQKFHQSKGFTQPHFCAERKNAAGFTFVEILIALALIMLLVATAAPIYTRLQGSTQLDANTRELAQTLRTAHVRAAARFNDASHGVYFQSDQYILYQGANYASRTPAYDRTILLDSALSLSAVPSVDEIVFSKGLGLPNATSTLTITHDVYGTSTVTVDALGTVQ